MAERKKVNEEPVKRLYKSRSDKIIDGVCAGFAQYFHIDVVWVRIIWVVSIFLNGLGVIAYIAAMIIMPVNDNKKEKSSSETSKHNPILFLGIGLIMLGLIIMFQRLDLPFHWHYPMCTSFHRWWIFRGDVLLPLVLIFAGIAYLIWILNRDKGVDEKKKAASKITHTGFQRSTQEKMIGGVCGGIAQYFKIDVTFIRIGFVIFALLGNVWIVLIAYAILLIVMPQSDKKTVEPE